MSSTEIDEERLHATTDASVWTEEFCKRFHVYDHIGDYWVDDEEGLMVGWFANAIETAKMAHAKASVDSAERDEWNALVNADTLHMLPIEAHIASVRYLAQRLLDLTTDA